MLSDLVNSDKKENIDLVASIRNKVEDLMNEIFKIDENEAKKNKKNKNELNETITTVEKYQNQEGHGLRILTPEQMLSRLPIYLAQSRAGNNSEKLKNKIRQLLHSLYS